MYDKNIDTILANLSTDAKTECGSFCHGSDEATSMDYSVLMSVYDKEQPEHLCLSIESMLMQTSAPAQFVLVKDGPLNDALEKAIAMP